MKTGSSWKSPLFAIALIFAFSSFMGGLATAVAQQPKADETKIIAVFFYAEWCNFCESLEPKLEKVKETFKDKPIMFTKFDMTNDDNKAEAKAQAAKLGATAIFEKYEGKTGFLLLLKKANGEKVGPAITFAFREDEIEDAIKEALAASGVKKKKSWKDR